MIRWLAGITVRRAPRRLVLGAVGTAFPVAMMAATLLYVDFSVHRMTRVALSPVAVEMKALATSLDTDMGAMGHRLEAAPGVRRAERFAAANVVVKTDGGRHQATARLFAVDPAYIPHHGFPKVAHGDLRKGALLGQDLHASPGFEAATRVAIDIPGQGRSIGLTLPVSGVADLRTATSWFEIPTGGVQGDVARVPRGIVIDFPTFERKLLPALKARLGTNTPVLNPDFADLPPVTVESHLTVDHGAYPSDPASAKVWSSQLRHRLERTAPGKIVVADNTVEVLTEADVDAADAKILFLLLGIPGVLAAAALGLAAESALAEAYRREDALLRLRGASDRQVARLATANAVLAALLGTILGSAVAVAGVSLVIGHAVWQDSSAGRLVASALLAAGVGGLAAGVRLVRLLRRGDGPGVTAERRILEAGWRPGWMRAKLDLVAIAVGAAILAINFASGGLTQTPTLGGPSIALSFYVLLAPIALWIGFTLLAIRGLLAVVKRRTRPERARPLRSWREAGFRWFGRRPARTGVALVLGTLAVAFATEVVTFVDTYGAAKTTDSQHAFGSDLRLTPQPSDVPRGQPALGNHVAAVTPIRYIGVRSDTDRKTVLTVDPSTYEAATSVAPRILEGGGFAALDRTPHGVLIAKEVATDLGVHPGDPLPLTIFPDDEEKKRNENLRVVGVYRSFPPASPSAEMVTTTKSFAPFLLPEPDFYLARTLAGHPSPVVADELRRNGIANAYAISTSADLHRTDQRTLAALNLGGLSQIESVGAGLIAAVGLAVLGAFIVLERRREFAVLRTVGIDGRRLLAQPAQEGLIAVLGSLLLGVPIGLGLGVLAVRVLALFFALPPPLLAVPLGTLAVFVLAMVAISALALAVALRAVIRVSPAAVLREP